MGICRREDKGPTCDAMRPEGGSPNPSERAASGSFRTKAWVRTLSIVLSFALAGTMFDMTELATAFANGQDGAPAIEGGQGLHAEVTVPFDDDGAEGLAAGDLGSDAGSEEQGFGLEAGSSMPSADASGEGSGAASDTALSGEGMPLSSGDTDALPEGLVPADQVLPQTIAGSADIAQRFHPSLSLGGVP